MPVKSAASSYRLLLRQVRQLPDQYVREFYRVKIADDVRKSLRPRTDKTTRAARIRRLQKELVRLERANSGSQKELTHVFDLAYGRKGPLKWTLFKSLQSSFEAPRAPRIIASNDDSRPPAYSAELTALLTSPLSRTHGRATPVSHLKCPPILPARVYPSSEEARLFGPLSKRRVVNLHWRFFKMQRGKLLLPLILSEDGPPVDDGSDVQRTRLFGLRGVNVLEDLAKFAGRVGITPPAPRRQRKVFSETIAKLPGEIAPVDDIDNAASTRSLRRRYRELLGRLPILARRSHKETEAVSNASTAKDYSVSLSPKAISQHFYNHPDHLADGDIADLAWVGRDDGSLAAVGKGGKHQKQKSKNANKYSVMHS